MENKVKKNILFLAITGLVLVMANMAVLSATRNGQLAPINNLTLWGSFVLLNICSLLWAVSLLGLQPMVVALSYVAGGLVAFQGVRMLPDVNLAEVTTAGATYGAFGALAIGHATTRVRTAFFQKAQVPFVFIIVALLVVDGFLNSRISGANLGVLINALILPFALAGVMVGLIWMFLVRSGMARDTARKPAEAAVELQAQPIAAEEEGLAAQLMFKVPENTEGIGSPEKRVETRAVVEPIAEPSPRVPDFSEAAVDPQPLKAEPVEEASSLAEFFPLEIDKTDEPVLAQADSNLMDLAARIAESAPELTMDAEAMVEELSLSVDPLEETMETTLLVEDPVVPIPEPLEEFDSLPPEEDEDPVVPIPEPVEEIDSLPPEPIEEIAPPPPAEDEAEVAAKEEVEVDAKDEVEVDAKEDEAEAAGSTDWLNGHLDLLNKL